MIAPDRLRQVKEPRRATTAVSGAAVADVPPKVTVARSACHLPNAESAARIHVGCRASGVAGAAWLTDSSARRLSAPAVAVYQTDVPGFASSFWHSDDSTGGVGVVPPCIAWLTHSGAVHSDNGILGAGHSAKYTGGHAGWTCGAFRRRRETGVRRAPDGKPIVGFIEGRLAPEKHVDRLRFGGLRRRAAGDRRRRHLTGQDCNQQCPQRFSPEHGMAKKLAEAYASMDVFVHSEHERSAKSRRKRCVRGLPIAPDAGGPRDLIARTTGLLLPVGFEAPAS